jgi:F-type H+-transporting ATPase subunit epsilon
MADTFELEIATPERSLAKEQVTEAELPGKNGYLGVLPGHAPLLTALGAGVLSFSSGSGRQAFAIDGGFAEIFDNHVRVLADHAEPASEIQADSARRELDEANNRLKQVGDPEESDAALRAMQRAQARLDAAERK